jgi:hypothetical protein
VLAQFVIPAKAGIQIFIFYCAMDAHFRGHDFLFLKLSHYPEVLRLGSALSLDWCRQKFLLTLVGAKIERLSIAFGMDGGRLVDGHSADRVLGCRFRFVHGDVPSLVVMVFDFGYCALVENSLSRSSVKGTTFLLPDLF